MTTSQQAETVADQKLLTLGYPGTGTGDHSPFDQVIPKGRQCSVKDIYDGKVDVLVIWGGADISPAIYGEKVARHTGATEFLSPRDKLEVDLCTAAINCNLPIIGVCRGAQLLCAMAGGKLVQHVNGHGRSHSIIDTKGRSVTTSSVHHQMMYPWDVEHELIAWSAHRHSDVYIGGDNADIVVAHEKPEPEIVFFPKIKGLAIQGHPEFMSPDDAFVKYCNDLVVEYLL